MIVDASNSPLFTRILHTCVFPTFDTLYRVGKRPGEDDAGAGLGAATGAATGLGAAATGAATGLGAAATGLGAAATGLGAAATGATGAATGKATGKGRGSKGVSLATGAAGAAATIGFFHTLSFVSGLYQYVFPDARDCFSIHGLATGATAAGAAPASASNTPPTRFIHVA